jgi:hypothetical protein
MLVISRADDPGLSVPGALAVSWLELLDTHCVDSTLCEPPQGCAAGRTGSNNDDVSVHGRFLPRSSF